MAGLVLATPGPGEQTMYRHQGTQEISLGSMASNFDAEAEEEAELGRLANGRRSERALRDVGIEAAPTPTRGDSLPSRRLRTQTSRSSLRSENSDRPSSRLANAAARERARLKQVQQGYDVDDDASSPGGEGSDLFGRGGGGPSNFMQVGEGTMDAEETRSLANVQVELMADTPVRPESGGGGRNGRERAGGGVKDLLQPKSLKDQDAEIKKLHDDHWRLQLAYDNLREMLTRYQDENIHKMMEDLIEMGSRLSHSERDRTLQKKVNKQLEKTVAAQTDEIADLKAQMKKIKRMYKDAKDGKGGTGQQALEEQVQKLEEEKEDLGGKVVKFEDEVDRLREELEDARQDGGPETQKLRSHLEQADADNESLKKEIEMIRSRIASRDEERSEHLLKISRLEEEILILKSTIEDKEGESNRTFAQAENIAEEADRIDGERRAALQALDDARAEIATLQDSVDELDERDQLAGVKIQELENDLELTNRELEALAEKNLRLDNEVDSLTKEKTELGRELQKADDELREADVKERQLRQTLTQLESDFVRVEKDRDIVRDEHEKLLQEFEGLEATKREANETKRKAAGEMADLESELRKERSRRQQEAASFKKESESEADRWRRIISDKEESNLRLSGEIESTRERLAESEQSVKELQRILDDLEDDRRRAGDDHTTDRFGLDMENQRLKRELEQREKEILRMEATLKRMEDHLADKEQEIEELIGDKRDLDNALATERADRSILSERLQRAERVARQAETESNNLRSRLDDLQRRLTEDQRSLTSSQRYTDGVRREAHELLTTVYLRVAKLSGSDEVEAPSTVPAMKDKLLARIRALGQAASDFERKLKSVENKVDLKFQGLNRELESKKKLLSDVENALAKVSAAKLSWKTKLTLKEDELADAKARLREVQAQLAGLRSNATQDNQSELRTTNLRAQNAEKRVAALTNQLAALQGQIADQESKHGSATSKWEARVAEFEKMLKASNERVKAERQGGKETQARLENTIKDYKEQIKTVNARSDRLQSVLSAAKMGTKDPDAL